MTDIQIRDNEEMETCFLFGSSSSIRKPVEIKPVEKKNRKLPTQRQVEREQLKPDVDQITSIKVPKIKIVPNSEKSNQIAVQNVQDDVLKQIQGFKSQLKKRRNTSAF